MVAKNGCLPLSPRSWKFGASAAPKREYVAFNPFTALISMYNFRADRYTQTHTNSVFFGPVRQLLSMLCVSIKIFSHAGAKKKRKRLKGFKFGVFIGGFQVTSW